MYKSTKNAYRFVNYYSSVPGTNKIIKTPLALLYSKVAKLRQPAFLVVFPVFQQAAQQTAHLKDYSKISCFNYEGTHILWTSVD